jgi:2-oxoisovalerate dehydrogenase E1 component
MPLHRPAERPATCPQPDQETLLKAWELMCTAKAMTDIYEEHFKFTSKYVHATSRGHEAIQLALGLQLKPQDFVAPYYRDDSILLGIGMRPYELMLQLMAKRDDPFSGGRTYYCHPSLRREGMPRSRTRAAPPACRPSPPRASPWAVVQGTSTGMRTTGNGPDAPVVVCSIGDAAITEGEVAEAFQMAVLKKLPIIYLVQDNEWDISASADEIRARRCQRLSQRLQGAGGTAGGWHGLPRLLHACCKR